MIQNSLLEEAIKLINQRNVTVDEMCKFIYTNIAEFQTSREDFYINEFKAEFGLSKIPDKNLFAKKESKKMIEKIERDVKRYSIEYATQFIDLILDAINEKQFKSKKNPKTFLTVLCSLKEINEN